MERPDTIFIPEGVAFNLQPAGVGSRIIAAVIDTLLLAIILALINFSFLLLTTFLLDMADSAGIATRWMYNLFAATYVLSMFGATWGFHVAFEMFRNGQTPGKRLMGLQVVRENGQALTIVQSGLRNIVRIVDFLPAAYVIGFFFVIFSSRAKRLGDFVAGTLVVQMESESKGRLVTRSDLSPEDEARLIAGMSTLEPEWLKEAIAFLDERQDMTDGIRALRARQIVENLKDRVSLEDTYDAEDLLVWAVQIAGRR